MIAPVIGDSQIPVRVRMGLCVVLTLLIAPTLTDMPQIEPFSALGILTILMQLLVGVAIGFMLKMVFAAVVVAGESIATSMGLGFAMINDPGNSAQVPIVSQFYTLFVTLLFLAFNGHHHLIGLVVNSFTYFPVGMLIDSNMLWQLVQWSSVMFTGALQMALPALAALLTVNLIMGIMTRTSPQLNLFSIGFPLTIMIGFVVILLTLPMVASIFQGLAEDGFVFVRNWLEF